MTSTHHPGPTVRDQVRDRLRAAAARYARAWAVYQAHEQPWRDDLRSGPAVDVADPVAAARLRRPTPRPVTGPDRRSAA